MDQSTLHPCWELYNGIFRDEEAEIQRSIDACSLRFYSNLGH